MSVCVCSMAGTAACQHCQNNPTATNVWSNSGTYTISKECEMYARKRLVKTNADRIRAMTDEELAEFIGKTKAFGYSHADLSKYFTAEFAEWLKKEVTDNSST